MANDKYLRIYLNDHLAGAVAGGELAKRAQSSNEGTELGDFLARLSQEIAEDRTALEGIIDTLGFPQDSLKQGAAWIAEKVGRLKLNGQLTGYSDLSRLVELEGLSVGVEAKEALWKSLRGIAGGEPRLDATQLDDLIARASRQREEIEKFRIQAAELAFAG